MDEIEEVDITEVQISLALFVQSLGYLLEDNEGVIVHFNDSGFVVWKNPINQTIEVMVDDEYLKFEAGRRTWIHYDGSTAPAADVDDDTLGENVPRIPKHLKN